MKTYTMTRMTERLSRFDDYISSTCYMLEGSKKNLLIDTGSGSPEEFRKLIEPFSDKPIILAITHAHADHYANAGTVDLFEEVYMHPDDIEILPEMNDFFDMAMASEGRDLKQEALMPIKEKTVLDLGDLKVEVIGMPGHSPGCICFLVHELGLLFTGDSIGSGGQFWMQLPHALTIKDLHKNLINFTKKLPDKEIRFLGGHYIQAGDPDSSDYKPVTFDTIQNLIYVCEHLLAGDNTINIEKSENPYDEPSVKIAHYKDVQMVFLPERMQ